MTRSFEWGKPTQQITQLNEEQLNEVSSLVAHCMLFINTKSGVYDYLEAKASSKRIAIIAALYLGHKMQ